MTTAKPNAVTYHFTDDTLRISAAEHFTPDQKAQANALKFKWWPTSKVWAATWTPDRADFAAQFAPITTVTEGHDVQARSARYKVYRQSAQGRAQERFQKASENLPPMGEPLKFGHHSIRRHRRDLERSTEQIRAAMKERAKAEYWQERAEATERAAAKRESPKAIGNKIRKLEADQREWNKLLKRVEAAPQSRNAAQNKRRCQQWLTHLAARLDYERHRLSTLHPAQATNVQAFNVGDTVQHHKYGPCKVIRVGRKNVRIEQLEGATKGWRWLAPPYTLSAAAQGTP